MLSECMLSMLLDSWLPPLFHPASPEAGQIGNIGNGFLIGATAMALLVIVLTIRVTRRYRHSKNPGEPSQAPGSRRLEIPMIGVPLLIVTAFFFWSMRTMNSVLPDRGGHAADVIITGHQWYWEVAYPGSGVVTANEIHLPAGRRQLLQLNSADVIHDWWVPALGGKMDMIPGRNNHLWVTTRDTGVYEGACSEFCGQQHAWMRIQVVVQPAVEFSRWLAAQLEPAGSPRDERADKGRSIFLAHTCTNCHRVKGTGANGATGPDLTHLASRSMLLAGRMTNDSANLFRWLADPQKVKEGALMPKFILPQDSIKALVAWLAHLE
ncbi:MAG: cytochrome c oxidase subunit II [Bacteroidetes bacterium]|nr:cytochrome c oxidase subunit II [Bacteroidota bacterium]